MLRITDLNVRTIERVAEENVDKGRQTGFEGLFPELFPYFPTVVRVVIGKSIYGIILAEMYILVRYGSLLRQ